MSLNSTMINGSRVVGPIVVAVLRSFGVTISQIFLINAVTYLFVVGALLSDTPSSRPSRSPRAGHAAVHRRAAHRSGEPGRVAIAGHALHVLAAVAALRGPVRRGRAAELRHRQGLHQLRVALRHVGPRRRLGGLAIGTVFVGVRQASAHPHRASSRSPCSSRRSRWSARPSARSSVGVCLGFAYFGTTTSMNTIFQSRVADHERGRVMSLWFMAFGGTVPIGNLVFAPLMDAIGARWVLRRRRRVGARPRLVLRHREDRRASRAARRPRTSSPTTRLPLTSTASPPASEPNAATGSATGGMPYRSVP